MITQCQQPARLEAVHIFPLSYAGEWTAKGLASKISDPAPIESIGVNKMNSVQNVLTLRSDVRDLWVLQAISVDVDV